MIDNQYCYLSSFGWSEVIEILVYKYKLSYQGIDLNCLMHIQLTYDHELHCNIRQIKWGYTGYTVKSVSYLCLLIIVV